MTVACCLQTMQVECQEKVSPHRPYADGGLRRKVIMREHRAHLAALLCKANAKRQKAEPVTTVTFSKKQIALWAVNKAFSYPNNKP